jgi:hypothetical protein
MILHIAKKEMLEMRQDGRFQIAAAIVMTLLCVWLAAVCQHQPAA